MTFQPRWLKAVCIVAIAACLLVVVVQCARADIVVEGRAVTVLTGPAIAAGVSVGAELPAWVPVIGTHLGFADLLAAADGREGWGGSVSTKPADRDDGWRVGAGRLQSGWSVYLAKQVAAW